MLGTILKRNSVRAAPIRTDRRRAVFILIAMAGVLPSALVLWFTSVAIRNEQLAAATIEEEAHQVLLNQIQSELVNSWRSLLEKATSAFRLAAGEASYAL